MRPLWIVTIKTRAKGGGWWGKPSSSTVDMGRHFGPPVRLLDGDLWYATGNPDLYITVKPWSL